MPRPPFTWAGSGTSTAWVAAARHSRLFASLRLQRIEHYLLNWRQPSLSGGSSGWLPVSRAEKRDAPKSPFTIILGVDAANGHATKLKTSPKQRGRRRPSRVCASHKTMRKHYEPSQYRKSVRDHGTRARFVSEPWVRATEFAFSFARGRRVNLRRRPSRRSDSGLGRPRFKSIPRIRELPAVGRRPGESPC